MTEHDRLYSVINDEGDVVLHWLCTEDQARRFQRINHLSHYRLIGPRGETL